MTLITELKSLIKYYNHIPFGRLSELNEVIIMKHYFTKGHSGLLICLALLLSLGIFSCSSNKQTSNIKEPTGKDKLVVIWSSADRDVAINMAMMYTLNSARFKWWNDITFVVWGPSAKLLTEDEKLQSYIANMLSLGITVKACKSCSDSYGVSNQLREMGITVKLMGELTDYLKNGRNILTF